MLIDSPLGQDIESDLEDTNFYEDNKAVQSDNSASYPGSV